MYENFINEENKIEILDTFENINEIILNLELYIQNLQEIINEFKKYEKHTFITQQDFFNEEFELEKNILNTFKVLLKEPISNEQNKKIENLYNFVQNFWKDFQNEWSEEMWKIYEKVNENYKINNREYSINKNDVLIYNFRKNLKTMLILTYQQIQF